MSIRICLLNMPFLLPKYPSLGLTQIKGRIKEMFKDEVEVRLFYLNHDIYQYLGEGLYSLVSWDSTFTLLNEWLFRHEAFDHIPQNFNEYVARFYPGRSFGPDVAEKIMNLGAFIQQLIAKYQLAAYDIIGINATFSLVPGLAFFRHLKQVNNKLVTVMGGANIYKEMGKTLVTYYPYLDYACSGSGLVSFPRLIKGFLENDELQKESIDGMFSRKNCGNIRNFSDELDINENINLDYHDFFESFSRFNPGSGMEPVVFLETSSGCYWRKCKFCGLCKDQLKYRMKSVDIAIEEINRYMNEYNVDIQMVDNVIPRHYIKKVLPHLRVPEGKHIVYEVRGDLGNEEMNILKQAKVDEIQPGFESLHTPIHQIMNKGVNAFQCINMLKLCVTYSITPGWNLILGFPGMTEDMYEALLSLIPGLTHLFPPQFLTPLRFDRYSVYWIEKETYDLELHPFSAYEFIYPYDDQFLSNIAYYFEDRNFFSERTQLLGEYYPKIKEQVERWKKRWQTDTAHLPRLSCSYKNGFPYIYDSRGEQIMEYKISLLQEKILKQMTEPMSEVSIKERFPDDDPETVGHGLGLLMDKGLIFKEGEQLMSLVIFNYPAVLLKPKYII